MRWAVIIPAPHFWHGKWNFGSKSAAQGFIDDRRKIAAKLGQPPLFLKPERY